MGLRTPWQDQYGFVVQTTNISNAPNFLTSDAGIITGKNGLLLIDEHPHLDPGQQVIKTRKATGQSTMRTGTGYEYQQGIEVPTFTFNIHLSAFNLVNILWLLFQKGASEAVGSPYLKTFTKYTSADAEVWGSVMRKMSAGTADSFAIHGCIVRSLVVSGRFGEPLIGTVEMVGRDWLSTFDFDSASSDLSAPEKAPILYSDLTVVLDAADTVNLENFEFTITNNATSPHYNTGAVIKHVLGDLEVTGTFGMPRDSGDNNQDNNTAIDDFIAGNDQLLKIYNSTSPASADASLEFKFNVRYNDAVVNNLTNELGTAVGFENADDGSNDISITLADTQDRTIP